MGFSSQEYWSMLPFPSPIYSEKKILPQTNTYVIIWSVSLLILYWGGLWLNELKTGWVGTQARIDQLIYGSSHFISFTSFPFVHFRVCVCVCVCVCVSFLVCSIVSDSFDPMGYNPPMSTSMEFSRQEYWSGLPYIPPGCLPDPGVELASLASPAPAGRFFNTAPPGKPNVCAHAYIHSRLNLRRLHLSFGTIVISQEITGFYFIVLRVHISMSWSKLIVLDNNLEGLPNDCDWNILQFKQQAVLLLYISCL